MHELTCVGCNRRFKAKSPRAKYHDAACRTRTKRAEAAQAAAAEGKPTRTPKDGPLVAAVIRDLEAAEQLDTVDGQVAVRIARELVVAKGTQVATLTKELYAVLARATGKGAPAPAGEVEEPPPAPVEEEPDELELARRRAAQLREEAAAG